MNYGKIIAAIMLPILFNLLTDLSEGYYPMRYVDVVDALVFIGLIGTLTIEFYGTYLILSKIEERTNTKDEL